jgi:transposase
MNTQEIVNNDVEHNPQNRQKKVTTPEFRAQVIGVYKSGVYDSVLACAKAYGINSKTLHGWLRKHDSITTPSAIALQNAELTALKKELAKAKMENEILKKAAIYFANQAQ